MTEQKPELIDELRKHYKNEWLVVSVTKHDSNGFPLEGVLLAHCPDEYKIHETILALWAQGETRELYSFFAGHTIPEGWEGVLYGHYMFCSQHPIRNFRYPFTCLRSHMANLI